ncbi:MAG: NAD(P)H-hydrate dehydratase [Pirellulaceae bacterium]|nr:NAD(P)H-hydrate dehydratase [Pirellulaceae bacterium]
MKHHLPKLNQRRRNSHKGDFGRALMIGGSRGMAGAISIASMAALRSGAGLVSAAVPSPILEAVAAMHPCLMTIPLESDQEGRISIASIESLERLCLNATCVALGPGMGRTEDLNAMVASLFQLVKAPMVVDADALNALSEARQSFPKASGPRILTPHPGEFERLSGVATDNRSDQVAAAIAMARENQWLIVLKGHETVITDGDATHINRTGNPKMAVGGSGDCLTGIITALICQGLDAISAARFGTALHGLAGDLAANRLGCPSVLATDLLEDLPDAFSQLEM